MTSKYGANTNQGILLSSIITLWNLGTIAFALPKIPSLNLRVPQLEFLKHIVPQKGFKALYRSLISDLVEVSCLGKYYEVISSRIVLEEEAAKFLAKEERVEFRRLRSHWKIPM